MVGRKIGGRRRCRLGRVTEFGIVAQQLVAVTLLEVVGDGIEEFKELCDDLGVEIVGSPLQAQRAGRTTREGAPGTSIRDAIRRGRAAGIRD